jgi:Zn-dependent protease
MDNAAMGGAPLVALIIVGIIAAVLVHEAAHWLAAHALGGRDVRVHLVGLSPKVSAELPPGAVTKALFFVAGMLANITVAAVLVAMATPTTIILGALQALLALSNLLPLSGSDGAQLWHLWSRRRR